MFTSGRHWKELVLQAFSPHLPPSLGAASEHDSGSYSDNKKVFTLLSNCFVQNFIEGVKWSEYKRRNQPFPEWRQINHIYEMISLVGQSMMVKGKLYVSLKSVHFFNVTTKYTAALPENCPKLHWTCSLNNLHIAMSKAISQTLEKEVEDRHE